MYSPEVIADIKKDIEEYVITDIRRCVEMILVSKHVVFFDTGFVSRIGALDWNTKGHACLSKIEALIDPSECVIVLTELMLYEMKDSEKSVLQRYNRELLINMRSMGYNLVMLCEDLVEEELNAYLNTNIQSFNAVFEKRIIDNIAYLRTIATLLKNDKYYGKIFLTDHSAPSRMDYISKCIGWLKEKKSRGDSLAEEIVVLCIMMFLDMPSRTHFLFCTNDKHAGVNLMKAMRISQPREIHRGGVVMYGDLV